MSANWIAVGLVAAVALACVGMCVGYSRQARECDRLNAEEDEYARNWGSLTDADRAWLLDNGAREPSLIRWEMR